ncbi:MAG TPA: hypothetical protein VM327_06120 [Candidatus Thermoplasmatota archaeon]|nr:hypothetical protein [Candidatus Thermoplasmatota archaeon]
MDRLRLGLILLALAPAAWLFAGSADYLVGLLLMLAGFALAVWAVPAENRPLGAVAFALAGLGVCVFYSFALFQDLPSSAGAIVVVGCVIAAFAMSVPTWRILAVGLALVALGAALWVYSDYRGDSPAWQPGNVLAFAGAVLAALGAATRVRAVPD